MAHEEKLPWELIEEILSYVPPQSLVRFRTVSHQWNTLFNDKTFINNHKTTFRFILSTKSKIYSVSINPKIDVRELTLDNIPESKIIPNDLVDCNGVIMLYGTDLVWNPWLNQTRRIKPVDQSSLQVHSIGYDDDNGYKTLGYCKESSVSTKWKTSDFDSDVWKSCELDQSKGIDAILHSKSVSLDGSLYWIASYNDESMFCLVRFDFSTAKFHKVCDLPCGDNHHQDVLVLGVFKEDRISLLKQCHLSKKIEIWVTKNKIHKLYDRHVEWINIMEVMSIPYLQTKFDYPPSYIIDDGKRFIVCSCDETGRAWIYVVGDKKLISKTKLDLVVEPWPLHCTYFPSLVSVSRGEIRRLVSFTFGS